MFAGVYWPYWALCRLSWCMFLINCEHCKHSVDEIVLIFRIWVKYEIFVCYSTFVTSVLTNIVCCKALLFGMLFWPDPDSLGTKRTGVNHSALPVILDTVAKLFPESCTRHKSISFLLKKWSGQWQCWSPRRHASDLKAS